LWFALLACATTTGGVLAAYSVISPLLTDRAPVAASVLLVAVRLLSDSAWPTAALVLLLGLFGVGVNPVLIASVVRFAGHAPTLASSLTVSAFNSGARANPSESRADAAVHTSVSRACGCSLRSLHGRRCLIAKSPSFMRPT
jgi:hypothetical protein